MGFGFIHVFTGSSRIGPSTTTGRIDAITATTATGSTRVRVFNWPSGALIVRFYAYWSGSKCRTRRWPFLDSLFFGTAPTSPGPIGRWQFRAAWLLPATVGTAASTTTAAAVFNANSGCIAAAIQHCTAFGSKKHFEGCKSLKDFVAIMPLRPTSQDFH